MIKGTQGKFRCFFITDLHGRRELYQKLFQEIRNDRPDVLFMGGDLLPSGLHHMCSSPGLKDDFVYDFLGKHFLNLRAEMGKAFPKIFLILGNDDGCFDEAAFLDLSAQNLWIYIHNRCVNFNSFNVFGYSFIPPSPFSLKDWERYDVSRYVDPGCSHPYEGFHSIPKTRHEMYFQTIKDDLESLVKGRELTRSVFLFHSPPYQTKLDRADLDGKMIDHVPMNVHVGSIAIKRFIEKKQPLITLHGHVHESSQITGSWKDRIKETYLFSAAYQGDKLSLIIFDPFSPKDAIRKLL